MTETPKIELASIDARFFEHSLELLGIANTNGHFVRVNPALIQRLGYQQSELLDRPFLEFVHPEDIEKTREALTVLEQGRTLVNFRNRYRTYDGSYRTFDWTARPDPGGELLYAAARDVTEMMELEDALHIEKERLDTILQFVVDGVITFDENAIIQSFNRSAEGLFGYPAEEIVGHKLHRLFPRPVATEMKRTLDRFLETGDVTELSSGLETSGLTSDGKRFPILLFVNELPVDDTMFLASVRDLREQKALDRELQRRQHVLEKTADFDRLAADVMEIFNRRAPIPELLDEMLELLADGLELFPASVHLYDEWSARFELVASYGLPPEFQRDFDVGEGLVGEVAERGDSLHLAGKDSDAFQLSTGIGNAPLKGIFVVPITQMERVLGVLTLATQVSETGPLFEFAKRISRQIGVAIENIHKYEQLTQLSNQLNERGQRIAEQNQKLERANRMKSEFLANMSHELRTPLNAIIGFAEVLDAGIAGELNEKQGEYAREIFQSGHHLLSLINDILDLSKVEAGAMELDRTSIDVGSFCKNVISVVREAASKADIDIRVDVEDDIGTFSADHRKLKQILYNLLSNAVKFTEEGGTVVLSAAREEDEIVLAVEDDGIGIAEEDRDRLFAAFEQIDGSASRKYEGTGLGLALVKKLVELHGGTIDVFSKPGKGSRFEARFPIHAATDTEEQPRVAERPRARRVQNRAPLVLLVEDDEAAAHLFTVHLEANGYVVLCASTAQEGLDLLHEAAPDLLVLDLLLGQDDGWGVIEAMKEDARTARIPVVIVSITGEDNRTRGFSFGAAEVLQKPIAPDRLIQAIETLIQDSPPQEMTILLVDDEPGAVEVAALPLEDHGYRVLRSFSGRDAIQLAESENPDLLIVDLMMPEVTGFDVIDAVRANPKHADTPILVLTAKSLEAEERRHLEESIQGLVAKREFTIPRFLAEIRALMRDRVQPQQRAPRNHVLIVDDDPADRELLRVYLEEEGFSVIEAEHGKEALRLLDTVSPDVIVLDVNMPVMGAAEFLDVLSRKPIRNIPVVVVSGASEPDERVALTVERYLAKPIARHDLIDAICEATRDHRDETHLLVVDDDPRAIELTRSLLAPDEDLMISVAFGGAEALELIRQRRPDAVLLDLMMPEIDGFEVIAELRSDDETRDLPIIVMTAKSLSKSERQGLLENVDTIIEKASASSISLVEEIRRAVGAGAERR